MEACYYEPRQLATFVRCVLFVFANLLWFPPVPGWCTQGADEQCSTQEMGTQCPSLSARTFWGHTSFLKKKTSDGAVSIRPRHSLRLGITSHDLPTSCFHSQCCAVFFFMLYQKHFPNYNRWAAICSRRLEDVLWYLRWKGGRIIHDSKCLLYGVQDEIL